MGLTINGNRFTELSNELNSFLAAYNLPQESADEVLAGLFDDAPQDRSELTLLKIEYLTNFIKRWDIAENSFFSPKVSD